MHSVSSGKTFVTGQCEIVVVSPLQMSPPVIITPPVDCPQQLRFLLLFERKVARVRSKLKQTKCTRMARNLPERNGYRFIGSSSLHIHENQLASLRSVHMPAPVGDVAIFAQCEIAVVSQLQMSPPLFITKCTRMARNFPERNVC